MFLLSCMLANHFTLNLIEGPVQFVNLNRKNTVYSLDMKFTDK